MAVFSELTKQKKYVIYVIVIVMTLAAVFSYINKQQKSLLIASGSGFNSVALYKPLQQAPLVASPSPSLSQNGTIFHRKPHPQAPSVITPSPSLSQKGVTLNSVKSRLSLTPSVRSEHHSQSLISPMGNYSCQDSVCSELLSKKDKQMYTQCSRKNANSKPAKCHFINSTGRAAVALTSFPGSGNTWVRGLLESATGICTGAIYCDGTLRRQGFAGEYVSSGAVLVVKMHYGMPKRTNNKYGSAIHLVRNPFGALAAEYNREKSNRSVPGGSHINSVGKEKFLNFSGWRKFVERWAKQWKSHFTSWTQKQSNIPVLHVLYEDIKEDRVREVKRMLEFLGVPYSEEELRERLSEDFSLFHRSKHIDFDPYTPEQRKFVNQQIREALRIMRANNNENTVRIESYLT